MADNPAQDEELLILELRGRLDMAGFLAVAGLLEAGRASRILFDWSDLVSWDFRPPGRKELHHWLDDSRFIDCIAIVHHRYWNRQAAWFSALLRTQDCRVRSYCMEDYARALKWLRNREASGQAAPE